MLANPRSIGVLQHFRHPAFVAAVVIALVVGALLALGLRVMYMRDLKEGQARGMLIARLLEEETHRAMQAVDLVLLGMIDTLNTADLPENDETFRNLLTQRLRNIPHVRALFVIAPSGFIIHDTDYPWTPRLSLADRRYFQVHRAGTEKGLFISPPLRSRVDDRWFVSISRRIGGPDGSFGGVVVAAVEPTHYEKLYGEYAFDPRDAIALWHKSGTLISRLPPMAGLVGTTAGDALSFLDRLPEQPLGTFESARWPDGLTRIISYRSVADYPILITTALAKDSLLQNWWRTTEIAISGYALFTILALAATYIAVDARSQRRAEAKRAAAMERLRTIGQMTGGIAHDIRNLISAVRAGLWLVDRYAGDPEKLRTHIKSAHEAVDRGADLATRLLSFAKAQEAHLTTANANDLLRNLEPLLRQAAGGGISMSFDLQPDLPPCRLDVAQFDAALLNLVINSRDAMPNGGRVHISTAGSKYASESRVEPCARVRVHDTGAGMDEAQLARIFEPFYTTKGEQGTGLGLPQIQTFMQEAGGHIEVTSTPGAGTTVDLLFPAHSGRAT